MHSTRDANLCLATDFCSGDHKPKSLAVALASCWSIGCRQALDLIVVAVVEDVLILLVRLILSALPEANRLPSREQATQ